MLIVAVNTSKLTRRTVSLFGSARSHIDMLGLAESTRDQFSTSSTPAGFDALSTAYQFDTPLESWAFDSTFALWSNIFASIQ
jgi:hypothetical protein